MRLWQDSTHPKPLLALLVLAFVLTAQTLANPTLIINVHGYTLADNRLKQFNGLVFEAGKAMRRAT
jgi:hypothetical protein